ncbi:jg22739, partial [Pararge aegeria aegeria]
KTIPDTLSVGILRGSLFKLLDTISDNPIFCHLLPLSFFLATISSKQWELTSSSSVFLFDDDIRQAMGALCTRVATDKEITTENCITKKFHKILQSQLDCVWHQLSTRTKEYIQDLKVLRTMILNLIHDDSVSFYALVNKYRTPEYAKVNSGWILLDSAETLFRLAKSRVFNSKFGNYLNTYTVGTI